MYPNSDHLAAYRELRALGWRAQEALRTAKIEERFFAVSEGSCVQFEGSELCDDDAERGDVRLLVVSDSQYDDSYLDTLELTPAQVERERRELWERIERDGITGIQAQIFDGENWDCVDSIYGFVGDDWMRSGYDADCMDAALDARRAMFEHDARELETSRPDLYA